MVIVTYDLSPATRQGLANRQLTMVISHPFMKIGQEAIAAMLRGDQGAGPQIINVPFDLYTPENL